MAMLVFEINKRQPLAEGRSFGATGAYERIDGIAHFGDRSVVSHSPHPLISLKLKGLLRGIWCYRS